jgi:hypothetical protein
MDELVRTLNRYGIDTGQLQLLYDAGPETTYYMPVAGQDVLARWAQLRELTERTGYWPVLLGYEEYELLLRKQMSQRHNSPSTGALLAATLAVNPQQWFTEMLKVEFSYKLSADENKYRGEWPTDVPPSTEIITPYEPKDYTPRPVVYLGLVPTQISWQVPILLRFGSWNSCPRPEIHAATLRYWEERYSVEIVALTYHAIEVRVPRPPQERENALALAFEQFAYCPDTVYQDMDTIDRLAATLLNGTAWWFWWD